MDVVLAAIPAYGHVYPLMPLAREVRSAGHAVTLATGRPFPGVLDVDTVPAFPEHATLRWAEAETRRAHPDLVVLESGHVGAAVAAHVLDVPAVAVAVGLWDAFGTASSRRSGCWRTWTSSCTTAARATRSAP
jgi:hypothetical protein